MVSRTAALMGTSAGRAGAWRGSDQVGVSEVVPGFELTVDELFASLRQE